MVNARAAGVRGVTGESNETARNADTTILTVSRVTALACSKK